MSCISLYGFFCFTQKSSEAQAIHLDPDDSKETEQGYGLLRQTRQHRSFIMYIYSNYMYKNSIIAIHFARWNTFVILIGILSESELAAATHLSNAFSNATIFWMLVCPLVSCISSNRASFLITSRLSDNKSISFGTPWGATKICSWTALALFLQ